MVDKHKKLLKKDPYIKLTDGTPTTSFIEFRTLPMTHHQEILERLTHNQEIDKKIEIAKKYISETKETELCKETLNEITNLFVKEADKLYGTPAFIGYRVPLLLEEIQGYLKVEPGKYKNSVEAFIRGEERLPELINNMSILEYRKQALGIIKKVKPEKWQNEFVSVFLLTAAICGNSSSKTLLLKTSSTSSKK